MRLALNDWMSSTMTDKTIDPSLLRLLRSLTREFFQTETSAVRHCTREAERLGDVGPARAMLAIAHAAEQALKAFPPIATAHDLPVSGAGMFVGSLFSE